MYDFCVYVSFNVLYGFVDLFSQLSFTQCLSSSFYCDFISIIEESRMSFYVASSFYVSFMVCVVFTLYGPPYTLSYMTLSYDDSKSALRYFVEGSKIRLFRLFDQLS